MKKIIYGLVVAIGMLTLASACEKDSIDEQTELFSPDPDEYVRPGGGGNG